MEILVLYVAIGIASGFTGGLFGVGGGVIVVPVLLLVFTAMGFSESVLTHMAVATSLAVMIMTSISSAWTHIKQKALLKEVFLWMLVGVLVGTCIGVSVAVNLTGSLLQTAFGGFLLYVGVQMLAGFKFSEQTRLPSGPLLSFAGAAIGSISMLFGIGGGSMTVPFLCWRGVTPQKAVATSATLGIPIAVMGAVLFASTKPADIEMPAHTLGYVYWPAFLGLAVASIPAARAGAKIAHRLPATILRKGFGIFILMISFSLLWKNLVN